MDVIDGKCITRYTLSVGEHRNVDTFLSFEKAIKKAEKYIEDETPLEIFHYFVSSAFVEIMTMLLLNGLK